MRKKRSCKWRSQGTVVRTEPRTQNGSWTERRRRCSGGQNRLFSLCFFLSPASTFLVHPFSSSPGAAAAREEIHQFAQIQFIISHKIINKSCVQFVFLKIILLNLLASVTQRQPGKIVPPPPPPPLLRSGVKRRRLVRPQPPFDRKGKR